MNKQELIDAISERTTQTKKQTDAFLTAALEVIMESVAEGDKVVIVGFGSFEPKERKGRQGRNLQTGEPMEIPARRVPAFSAGKVFKEKVG